MSSALLYFTHLFIICKHTCHLYIDRYFDSQSNHVNHGYHSHFADKEMRSESRYQFALCIHACSGDYDEETAYATYIHPSSRHSAAG